MRILRQKPTMDAEPIGHNIERRREEQPGVGSCRRFAVVVWCLTAVIVGLAGQAVYAEVATPICASADESPTLTPHLVMSTAVGEIVIELHEDAAPEAVRGLVELVRGSKGGMVLEESTGSPSAAFDGLAFDHCKPHIEIRTSIPRGEQDLRLPNQMCAAALGLDEEKVADTNEAMSILQNELLAANQVAKRTGWTNKILQGWMDEWRQSHSADFLVGIPLERVNRALGYVYEEGLKSRPVTAGTVTLVPVSPREALARLSITLTDMPSRTGRWMVIGTVTEGFELAQTISEGPLTPEKALKYRPLRPVVIEKTEVECR